MSICDFTKSNTLKFIFWPKKGTSEIGTSLTGIYGSYPRWRWSPVIFQSLLRYPKVRKMDPRCWFESSIFLSQSNFALLDSCDRNFCIALFQTVLPNMQASSNQTYVFPCHGVPLQTNVTSLHQPCTSAPIMSHSQIMSQNQMYHPRHSAMCPIKQAVPFSVTSPYPILKLVPPKMACVMQR